MVGLRDELRTLTLTAAQACAPAVNIETTPSVQKALEDSQPEDGLLVLGDPEPTEVERALSATDRMGLPRWTVIAFTAAPQPKEVEAVLPETSDERLVAQVLRSALERHRLRREVARTKGDLWTIASRISHDLRASLGGIVTTGEALKEVIGESTPPCAALMGTMFESADGMAKLINRVSFVARASANPVAKTSVDMGQIYWAAQQRMERQRLRKKATLIAPDSWPVVQGVASWLETVWWNLLANALQHGAPPQRVEAGYEQDRAGHRFWVQDNGSSVAAEKRNQLFQPFHLLHNLNSGRGLGLSIVQRLVELQGGQCGYEPLLAGGSCFFFTLPAEGEDPGVQAVKRMPLLDVR